MVEATLALSALIGFSLGLLGGGGSILTVPILTYMAQMAPKDAIAASLFVVAVTSAAAMLGHARAGRVMWRTGLLFGAAGMAGAFVTGRLAAFVPARVLMIAFGVMMAVTAIAMLRPVRGVPAAAMLRPARAAAPGELSAAKAVLEGLLIGAVTGLIGVGGGFMIVPALVLFARVPMERAVATSLLVISMNSVAGFAGHVSHASIDWWLTMPVTAIAVVASVGGANVAGRISPVVLRRAFGVLVVLVAALVLVREIGF